MNQAEHRSYTWNGNIVTLFKTQQIHQTQTALRKNFTSRVLSRSEHRAHVPHWCDNCCSHIQPWEIYEKSVRLLDNNKILEIKNHVDPGCEPPEEPDIPDEIKDANRLAA